MADRRRRWLSLLITSGQPSSGHGALPAQRAMRDVHRKDSILTIFHTNA